MSKQLFEYGRRDIANDVVNFTTGTIKMMPITRATAATNNKAITGATNATPIVITMANTTGYANGDLVSITGVGGNTAANGTWVVAGLTGTTINLTTVPAPGGTSLNSTGNGAYTSGGTCMNLTAAWASTDVSAARAAGATDATLTISATSLGKGIVTATANPTFTVNASTTVDAMIVYQSAATDRLVWYEDGKMLVRVASNAATSATTIIIEPLPYGIANSTALIFSNGITATLTAGANAGDRTLTVSALSGGINAGHHADAPVSGAGFPLTTGGSTTTVTYSVDGTGGLFKV